jgi:hypothetical protein
MNNHFFNRFGSPSGRRRRTSMATLRGIKMIQSCPRSSPGLWRVRATRRRGNRFGKLNIFHKFDADANLHIMHLKLIIMEYPSIICIKTGITCTNNLNSPRCCLEYGIAQGNFFILRKTIFFTFLGAQVGQINSVKVIIGKIIIVIFNIGWSVSFIPVVT